MLFFVQESVLCDPKFCDWPKIDPKFITSIFENCLKSTKKARNLTILGFFLGTLEGTRTPDLLIRSQSLYPTELPAHTTLSSAYI